MSDAPTHDFGPGPVEETGHLLQDCPCCLETGLEDVGEGAWVNRELEGKVDYTATHREARWYRDQDEIARVNEMGRDYLEGRSGISMDTDGLTALLAEKSAALEANMDALVIALHAAEDVMAEFDAALEQAEPELCRDTVIRLLNVRNIVNRMLLGPMTGPRDGDEMNLTV